VSDEQPTKGMYKWNVYYKGKEGFAEGIEITTDKVEDLQSARATISMWLQAIEAETLPRDKEGVKTAGWGRPAAAPRPAGQPAPAQNGNAGVPDEPKGIAPVCAECGGPTKWKSGFAGPNAKNPGKPYGFYSCVDYPRCRGRAA
jgi:hypothetical protein